MSRIKYVIDQSEMKEVFDALTRAKKLADFDEITQMRAFACTCAIDQAVKILSMDQSERPSEDHY